MSSSLTVTPLATSDISSAVDLVYLEKLTLTVNRVMWTNWPDEAAQKTRIRSAVTGSLSDKSVESLKAVDEESGEMVGLLVLSRKRPAPAIEEKATETKSEAEPAAPAGPDASVLAVVVGMIEEITKGSSEVEHLEITALAVEPSELTKGARSALLQAAIQRAKDQHISLMVNADGAAVSFYKNQGFQEVKHSDIDLSKYAAPFSGFGVFRLTRMTWTP